MGEQAIKMALDNLPAWWTCLYNKHYTSGVGQKLGLGFKNLENDLNLYTTFSNTLHLY